MGRSLREPGRRGRRKGEREGTGWKGRESGREGEGAKASGREGW